MHTAISTQLHHAMVSPPSERHRFVALIAFALLACGCHERTIEIRKLSGDGFQIYYPERLSHSSNAPLEDFELHRFDASTGNLLTLYVGNHADFPSEDLHELEESKSSSHGLATRSVSRVNDDGAHDRDVLVQLPESNDWPQMLHFWYRGLDAANAETADAIIDSAQLSPSS